MKLLTLILFILPSITFAQTHNKNLVDSLKFVTDMPYICRDIVPSELSVGCGDIIFWRTVKQKQEVIPYLLDKLSDTTNTNATVPNFGGQYAVGDIAYFALKEIIQDAPTIDNLLGFKVDTDGGRTHYWEYLRQDINNRVVFQMALRNWYENNMTNLIWITNNTFSVCDCVGRQPNGGHFELKK